MTLGDYQRKFSLMVAKLIQFAYDQGYEITLGEAWRTPQQAALNAKDGIGISNSLHRRRLAIDLILFKNGVMLPAVDYLPLVEYWEQQGGSAGYRFKMVDAQHFSLSPDNGATR